MPSFPRSWVTTNVSKDVLNAIRNSASTDYKNYVPIATENADSIKTIGNVLMDNPALRNEFINTLVNAIAFRRISSRRYESTLRSLQKGMLDYGETVEDIFIAMADVHQFEYADSTAEYWKVTKPDVKVAYYVVNSELQYPLTILEYDLRRAFNSYNGVTDFISRCIEQVYTAAAYDEYIITKYMLAKAMLDGHVTPLKMDTLSEDNMKNIVANMKMSANDFTFMNERYNIAGVKTFTPKEEQVLLVTNKFDAMLSVDVLAYAFNMDKADIETRKIAIDSFAVHDNDRLSKVVKDFVPFTDEEEKLLENVIAMQIDENFVQIYDKLVAMEEDYNHKGMGQYWWYNLFRVYAISPFANTRLYTTDDSSVSTVTVTPSTAKAVKGTTLHFSAEVKGTGFINKEVTWSCTGTSTIDAGGNLNVKDASEVTVTATSVADNTKQGTATVTVLGED